MINKIDLLKELNEIYYDTNLAPLGDPRVNTIFNARQCVAALYNIQQIMDDPKYSMRGALEAINNILKEL